MEFDSRPQPAPIFDEGVSQFACEMHISKETWGVKTWPAGYAKVTTLGQRSRAATAPWRWTSKFRSRCSWTDAVGEEMRGQTRLPWFFHATEPKEKLVNVRSVPKFPKGHTCSQRTHTRDNEFTPWFSRNKEGLTNQGGVQ